MTKGEEKRKSPRRTGETLVRFEGSNYQIWSRATDMSETGAFLATHYLLDPGTRIRLHVLQADGKETRTEAQVVRWVGQEGEGKSLVGLGIQFMDDDEDPTLVKEE